MLSYVLQTYSNSPGVSPKTHVCHEFSCKIPHEHSTAQHSVLNCGRSQLLCLMKRLQFLIRYLCFHFIFNRLVERRMTSPFAHFPERTSFTRFCDCAIIFTRRLLFSLHRIIVIRIIGGTRRNCSAFECPFRVNCK